MLKTGHFNPLQEVTTQHDAAIISDLDKKPSVANWVPVCQVWLLNALLCKGSG